MMPWPAVPHMQPCAAVPDAAPLTQQRDLVALAVKGHKGVQAAANAARAPLLHAVAQEDDLALKQAAAGEGQEMGGKGRGEG